MAYSTPKEKRKRKHYPGDLREPGTKDYSLILGLLMNYRNALLEEEQTDEVLKLYQKIGEKLQELGFKRAAKSVKAKAGQPRKAVVNKQEVIQEATLAWEDGKTKHQLARDKQKTDEQKSNLKKNTSAAKTLSSVTEQPPTVVRRPPQKPEQLSHTSAVASE